MGEVNVDDLKIGMILEKDLKDKKGRFLLGKGCEIEKKHIRIMKIWGIVSAYVEGVTKDQSVRESMAQILPEKLEHAKKWVDFLFQNSIQEHDALNELKRLCILHFTQPDSQLERVEENIDRGELIKPNETISPMDQLVEKNIQLSSFPDIYYQIMNVLNDTHSSALHLAEVVRSDPGLSASMLKLVNSAYFGLPSQVDSIQRAVALIGGRELSALAMGISVVRFFKDIPSDMVDMKSFWLHSVSCGIIARALADGKIELAEELYFTGGMLHDIGRLIMFTEYPKAITYAIQIAKQERLPLLKVEREIFGFTHSDVSGLLLEKWNFPPVLVDMVRHHHNPEAAGNRLDASIIQVADIIATAMHLGDSGNQFVPAFEKNAWDVIGHSPGMLDFAIKQARRQITETLDAFNLRN